MNQLLHFLAPLINHENDTGSHEKRYNGVPVSFCFKVGSDHTISHSIFKYYTLKLSELKQLNFFCTLEEQVGVVVKFARGGSQEIVQAQW